MNLIYKKLTKESRKGSEEMLIEVKGIEREQITIRLPAELKEKLQQEADRRGDSLNGLIVMMLDKACKVIHQD